MAYMAVAFDTGDLTALRTVTTPQSRRELYDMWPNPVHLRLSRCEKESGGSSYVCYFPRPPEGHGPELGAGGDHGRRAGGAPGLVHERAHRVRVRAGSSF